jgi:DNA-binding NarL/FixJ family response regulator
MSPLIPVLFMLPAPTAHLWQAIVLDDHPMVSRGVSEFLKHHARLAQVLSASDAAHCLTLTQQLGSEVIVIADFWLASGNAVPLIEQLLRQDPTVRILVMSGDDDPLVEAQAKLAGAHGFIVKQASPQVFESAVSAVIEGLGWFESTRSPLAASQASNRYAPRELGITRQELGMTLRQAQILQEILDGEPNKRIAQKLNISESTIKEHVIAILQKLGVSNRVAAITQLRGRRLVLDP